jgi:hypothetical protein
MVDDETGSGEGEAEVEGLFKTEMIWFEDRVLLEMFLRSCEDTRAILWREGMGRRVEGGGEDETRYIDLRSRGWLM